MMYTVWAKATLDKWVKTFLVGYTSPIMDHLEASATLPQRNSARGKAAPQRPWTG
jgi:hypothetical protein